MGQIFLKHFLVHVQLWLTSSWALMVEEDPVDSEHVVGLSEVHHNPVGVQLSSS